MWIIRWCGGFVAVVLAGCASSSRAKDPSESAATHATQTELRVSRDCAETEAAVASARSASERGAIYEAAEELDGAPRCAATDDSSRRALLHVLSKLRDGKRLTRVARSIFADSRATLELKAAARRALAELESRRSPTKLAPEERVRFDALLDEIALLSARSAWTEAAARARQALAIGESGELLFEAGLVQQGLGSAAAARELFDASATLLEAELGTSFVWQTYEMKYLGRMLWAGSSTIWLSDRWLYDLSRKRFVAYAPSARKEPHIVAAAERWVYSDEKLWSLDAAEPLATIQADAAAPSPDGERLYVLRGSELLLFGGHTGQHLKTVGPIERTPFRKGDRELDIAPSERFVIVQDGVGFVLHWPGGATRIKLDAFGFLLLTGDWLATIEEQLLQFQQLETGRQLRYAWRKPPYYGHAVFKSWNGTTLLAYEPVIDEVVVFRAPAANAPLGNPVRIPTVRSNEPARRSENVFRDLSPDGALAAAMCGPERDQLCLIETSTGRDRDVIAVPRSLPAFCRLGLRLYPPELCEPRMNVRVERRQTREPAQSARP